LRAVVARPRSAISPILQPGRNCWTVDGPGRFYCIQDADDYFRLLHAVLPEARESIFVLGWDITGSTDLRPGETDVRVPGRFDRLIAHIARRRPHLRVYILIWDYGSVYTLERDPLSRWRFGWRTPRNVRFGFDDRHPVGGSHHQKVIVVDDRIAFCGGIDVTSHRWDTSAHRPDEPQRATTLGGPYGPYHEVQAMVDGPAAASLGRLARERWQALGASRLPAVSPSADDRWPAGIEPDLIGVDIAIARTRPASASLEEVRECEALFPDSIAAARHAIYIESQYFTSDAIGEALGRRLAERDGPEIVVVSPKECHGWLEHNTMGQLREGVFRRLLASDAHKRLRLVYPAASLARDLPTFVHSKVMIVDDVFARIGSANCSNRSMGVDTECDLAVEAGDAQARAGIAHIRDRLLAEHLGLDAGTVKAALARGGSLTALIDAHDGRDRSLARIDLAHEEPTGGEVIQAALDPAEPMGFGSGVERLIPALDVMPGHTPIRVWVLPAIVLAAAGLVGWASTSAFRQSDVQVIPQVIQSVSESRAALWFAIGIVALAGVMLTPLELLAIAAGVVFGPVRGGLVAVVGSIGASALGYGAGRAIGPAGLVHWMRQSSYRSGLQLGRRGVAAVAVWRLSAVGSAGSIQLMCGAARMPFGSYLAGSALGLAPVMLAFSGLGSLLQRTIVNPSIENGAVTIGAALLLIAAGGALRAFFLIRQFAPTLTRHRRRAEFG